MPAAAAKAPRWRQTRQACTCTQLQHCARLPSSSAHIASWQKTIALGGLNSGTLCCGGWKGGRRASLAPGLVAAAAAQLNVAAAVRKPQAPPVRTRAGKLPSIAGIPPPSAPVVLGGHHQTAPLARPSIHRLHDVDELLGGWVGGGKEPRCASARSAAYTAARDSAGGGAREGPQGQGLKPGGQHKRRSAPPRSTSTASTARPEPTCLSFMAQLILLLLPVPRSTMMCCWRRWRAGGGGLQVGRPQGRDTRLKTTICIAVCRCGRFTDAREAKNGSMCSRPNGAAPVEAPARARGLRAGRRRRAPTAPRPGGVFAAGGRSIWQRDCPDDTEAAAHRGARAPPLSRRVITSALILHACPAHAHACCVRTSRRP